MAGGQQPGPGHEQLWPVPSLGAEEWSADPWSCSAPAAECDAPSCAGQRTIHSDSPMKSDIQSVSAMLRTRLHNDRLIAWTCGGSGDRIDGASRPPVYAGPLGDGSAPVDIDRPRQATGSLSPFNVRDQTISIDLSSESRTEQYFVTASSIARSAFARSIASPSTT